MAASVVPRCDLSSGLKRGLLSLFRPCYKHAVHRGVFKPTLTRSSSMMSNGDGPIKSVKTHHLSKGIVFYANEGIVKPPTSGQAKPLLLMLPWLGAKPQAQAKYYEFYLRKGFDVLVVETKVSQFLWPRWGLELGGEVLKLLESDTFSNRPLVVHAFSIGAYTFGQVLVHVTKDTRRYRNLIDRVQGQIYDSLVLGSVERMAIGVSQNLFPNFERLVKHTSLLYFQVFKRQTVDYFNRSIDSFWNTPLTSPALYYYCGNDVLCDPEVIEKLQEDWRRRGISVTSKKWEESIHVGHLRAHPQEYMSALEHFLCSIDMLSLNAKM